MTRSRASTALSLALFAISVLSIAFWASSKTVVVVGMSMEPTHPPGTRLIASSAYWLLGKIARNDVVAFADPEDPSRYLIKRIYAIGGDQVDPQNTPSGGLFHGDYRVPVGQVYVLGDNRDNSVDSRTFGPIPEDEVIGKCVHFWGGSMALPFVLGIGAIGMVLSISLALRRMRSEPFARALPRVAVDLQGSATGQDRRFCFP